VFLYPEQTKFGRVLPKNKVYGHAKLSRAVRQRFVDEVEEIVWRHKLAPETLRLPVKSSVTEIQVFEIALKTGDLREDVLRTIDRAVPSLIFFELTFEDRVRFAASFKRDSEIATGPPVVETYFETPWQDAKAPRLPLPVALDMAGLYEQMLRAYMLASPFALQPRVGETLAEAVERGSRIRAKRRECKQLEAKLRKESQFNRKVEINSTLRQLTNSLATLVSEDRKKGPL
jgi:Domain of unknown function (DUF4391)